MIKINSTSLESEQYCQEYKRKMQCIRLKNNYSQSKMALQSEPLHLKRH